MHFEKMVFEITLSLMNRMNLSVHTEYLRLCSCQLEQAQIEF